MLLYFIVDGKIMVSAELFELAPAEALASPVAGWSKDFILKVAKPQGLHQKRLLTCNSSQNKDNFIKKSGNI